MTHLGMGGLNLRQNSLIFISKYRSTSYSSFPAVFPMNPERIRIRIQHPSVADPNFSIPDLNFFHPESRIKEVKYFNPKLFLSSWNYDPGCPSRILILIFTHPGSRGQKGTATQHCRILSQCGSKSGRQTHSELLQFFFSLKSQFFTDKKDVKLQ
jgi:hypothetical protein